MKKFLFLAFAAILFLNFGAAAQDESNRYASSRLDNLITQLKRTTVDLVDRTTEDLRRGSSNSRGDLEAAFLATQLDASVGLYQDIARDNRRASDLRDGAAILSDLARRAPNYGANNSLWRDAQNAINDINRELGGYGGGGNNGGGNNGGGNNGGGGQRSGSVFWRGTVDKEVQLVIQNRNLDVRTISGNPYDSGTTSFTSALPRRNVSVGVIKRTGRGSVRVLQQPDRNNDYTAIVQILDDGGGAREYQLEISWQ